jgi:hypothetical protein
MMFFSAGYSLAADPDAFTAGDSVSAGSTSGPSGDSDESLDSLLKELDARGPAEKPRGPFSLVAVKSSGRRIESITLRNNVTGKTQTVLESKFHETRLNDLYRIEGAGRDRVLITDGNEKITLMLEKKKPVSKEPPATEIQIPMTSNNPGLLDSIRISEVINRLKVYFKALSMEMLVLHIGIGLAVLLTMLVMGWNMLRSIAALFTKDDEAGEAASEEIFDDDYEPDESEQEKIAERQALKEQLASRRIVDILADQGKITAEQAEEAFSQEKQTSRRAELYLAEKGLVKLQDVYMARAAKYGMEYVDLERFCADEAVFIHKRALGTVPFKLAQSAVLFPYRINSKRRIIYFLHSSEPNSSLENDIRRETGGYYSKFALAEEKGLNDLIKRMKNYYKLDEKFNIEDMMDPRKKKALKKKGEKKAQGIAIVKLAFYLIASLMIVSLGTWRYLINTPTARLKDRVSQCLTSVSQGKAEAALEFLDPESRVIMDSITLCKQLGVNDESKLDFFRISKVELDETGKQARVSWVGRYMRDGSAARVEHVNTWILSGRYWCFAAKDDLDQ